jgi:hypothetical protein
MLFMRPILDNSRGMLDAPVPLSSGTMLGQYRIGGGEMRVRSNVD